MSSPVDVWVAVSLARQAAYSCDGLPWEPGRVLALALVPIIVSLAVVTRAGPWALRRHWLWKLDRLAALALLVLSLSLVVLVVGVAALGGPHGINMRLACDSF